MKSSRVWLVLALLSVTNVALAQQRGGRGAAGDRGNTPANQDTTTGYPILDRNVLTYCRRCHVTDTAGCRQRVSYERWTTEGWELSVRRMVAVSNVRLDPAVARCIVRYLSDHHGRAPS